MVVVGAGRAGGSLARLWHQSGYTEIQAIYSRSGAGELAASVEAPTTDNIANLPKADFLLIATPDASLNTVATQIAQSANVSGKQGVAFHLSGACSSEELAPLRSCGFSVASAHPLRSFASSSQSEFTDTWCGIEGDTEAASALQKLFEKIGGRCFDINKSTKTAYHAATVISSNGLFALADVALSAWQRAGIEPEKAREIFLSLAAGTASNIARLGPTAALTGPVSRGDTPIVSRQLEELQSNDETGAEIYRTLSLRLLALAEQKLDPNSKKQLAKLLTTIDNEIR